MAQANLAIFVFILTLSTFSASANFLREVCATGTPYPALCIRTLSPYADRIGRSDRQIAAEALAISLDWTRAAALFLSRQKAGRRRELDGCVGTVGDAVRQLSRASAELGRSTRMRGEEFAWCMSNMERWVSTALTDGQTCADGLAGRQGVAAETKRMVVGATQVTDNALALINRYVAEHGR